MASVRPLEERDIPEVVGLFERVYPEGRWASRAECESYFREIFLGNPWVDPALASWVAHEGDGARMIGFIGVVPRPMSYKGRSIRAAVITQLMADREKRHGVAAAQLLRKVLAGPQELTISDGANENSRRMWEALGGSTSTLYSLAWQRPLRPVRCALRLMTSRRARAAALLAAPVAALADAYAARRMSLTAPAALRDEPLDAAALLAALQHGAPGATLRPQYDLQSLDWLLAQARAKRRHGELQARLLRQPDGEVAGWFLYYLNRGTSKVLQLEARKGGEAAVLGHLFHHAWRRGADAIEGRMEPRLARALSRQHCFFRGCGTYVLVQAREPAILAALERGESLFSRLEGEWWMRFSGEPRHGAGGDAVSELVSRLRFSCSRTRTEPALP